MLTLTFQFLMLPWVMFYCGMLHANSDLLVADVAEGSIFLPDNAG